MIAHFFGKAKRLSYQRPIGSRPAGLSIMCGKATQASTTNDRYNDHQLNEAVESSNSCCGLPWMREATRRFAALARVSSDREQFCHEL